MIENENKAEENTTKSWCSDCRQILPQTPAIWYNRYRITELVFILDRSGSMSGFEADTIGGFNATIEQQKEQAGKVYVKKKRDSCESRFWVRVTRLELAASTTPRIPFTGISLDFA